MPTGVPIRDVRAQLFAAAERVLIRDGPDALTSRAVTTEAGVAKGTLHGHFPDFDTFLASLVLAHVELLDTRSRDLRASAGTGTVAGNLAQTMTAVLTPEVVGLVSLVTSRRRLLVRLRLITPAGIPPLAEITKMIAAYLTAERGLGRIPVNADVEHLALIAVGSAYVLFMSREQAPPDGEELRELLTVAVDDTEQAHR